MKAKIKTVFLIIPTIIMASYAVIVFLGALFPVTQLYFPFLYNNTPVYLGTMFLDAALYGISEPFEGEQVRLFDKGQVLSKKIEIKTPCSYELSLKTRARPGESFSDFKRAMNYLRLPLRVSVKKEAMGTQENVYETTIFALGDIYATKDSYVSQTLTRMMFPRGKYWLNLDLLEDVREMKDRSVTLSMISYGSKCPLSRQDKVTGVENNSQTVPALGDDNLRSRDLSEYREEYRTSIRKGVIEKGMSFSEVQATVGNNKCVQIQSLEPRKPSLAYLDTQKITCKTATQYIDEGFVVFDVDIEKGLVKKIER